MPGFDSPPCQCEHTPLDHGAGLASCSKCPCKGYISTGQPAKGEDEIAAAARMMRELEKGARPSFRMADTIDPPAIPMTPKQLTKLAEEIKAIEKGRVTEVKCEHGFLDPHNLPGGLRVCVPGLRAAFDREKWEEGLLGQPFTATEALTKLDELMDKPLPTFPFSHRDRYEVAYTLLVWELLKLTEGSAPEGNISNLQVLAALTKAAGELT